MSFAGALTAEELLGDCYHEKITEFRVLDYFSLLYLDLPYIARKVYEGIQDNIALYKERRAAASKDKKE